MRINGKIIVNDNIEILVFPRGNGSNIVLKFRPIVDHSRFEELCKPPTPPTITPAGKEPYKDFKDKDYLEAQTKYFNKKTNWLFIQSMLATENLEFDTVNIDDPNTWDNIDKELETAQFTVAERNMMFLAYQKANSMDEDKLAEARESFLASTQGVSTNP
jgi:hypothetical protein